MNKSERTVSIREIIGYIFSKWKSFLVILIIGMAVTVAAVMVLKLNKGSNTEENQVVISDEDKEDVDAALEIYQNYIDMQEDSQNSYINRINPYRLNRFLAQYLIDSEYVMNYTEDITVDFSSELMDSYKTYCMSDEIVNKILNLGIDGLTERDLNYIIYISNSGRLLNIEIYAEDDETCREIFNVIDEEIKAKKDYMTELYGEHVVNEPIINSRITNNEKLLDYIETENDMLAFIENNLKKYTNNFNDIQNAYYEEQTAIIDAEAEAEAEGEPATGSLRGTIVKLAILVIGVMLVYCAVLFFVYVLSDKIRNTGDVRNLYGDVTVWELNAFKENKIRKNTGFLPSRKDGYGAFCYALVKFCKNNNINDLVFFSVIEPDKKISDDMEIITEYLKKASINCCYLNNIMNAGDSCAKLEGHALIAVEEIDRSSITATDMAFKMYVEKSQLQGAMLFC